jgi:hypothetical protein
LALALGLAAVLGATVTAQGPTGDVPFTEPEKVRVPLDKSVPAEKQAEKDAETDCYPCYYWVTGIRIQKLDYPNYQPLGGWQFTVFNSANQQVAQGATGPNGVVDFFNLPPGTYRVVETPQTNWQSYYPQSGQIVVPVYGGYVTFFRFYNRQGGIVPIGTPPTATVGPPPPPTLTPQTPGQVGTLRVCKLNVTNPQSPQPVGGWPFTVTRGQQVVGAFTTSAQQGGGEQIIQLPVGSYRVEEAMQPGWEFVRVVPDSDGAANRSTVVDVVAGQTTLVTFENRQGGQQTGGAVRVCKLDVTNQPERSVSGWPMSLQATGPGGGARYGYTGFDGCLTFTNLPAGPYNVEEGRPGGWEFVSVDPNDGQDPGYRTSVTVTGGETANVTFRNRRIVPASIKVCKLNVTSAPETPINGWQMLLRRPDNNGVLASGLTGTYYSGPGCVTFGNLVPGSYVIEEAAYPGWTFVSVTPDDGTTTDLRTTITVANGENATVTFRNRR